MCLPEHSVIGHSTWYGILSMITERNTDIRQKHNIMSILETIAKYWLNWWEHLCRMDDCRIPKQLWNYKPRGWRGVGGSTGVTSSNPCLLYTSRCV